ncbi:MAG: elongation factor Ts [Bacteroidia bacterium]|nr:elongation factor Ts [Bacteroidia bacterium]
MSITAADVNKLRQITGAGMMDCKKALAESGGDFDKAIEFLRKKGQKVAANRSDRDAKEGVVLAKTSGDNKRGILIVLNCETDFVAKNDEFRGVAETIAGIALDKKPATKEELLALSFAGNGLTIADKITEQVGKIGEKIELSKFEAIEAGKVVAYNHPGNKLATIVGFNKDSKEDVARDVAMQVAAMAPVAVDRGDVDPSMLEKEIEIAKEQLRNEGKPAEKIDMIAKGKIEKFYKESTLLNQEFIKDNKKTISQYLKESDAELKVTGFRRIALG